MKEFKNYLLCVIASLLAFTIFLGIPTSVYANEVKSAEQSVFDLFAAVQNNDYDTLNRVSVDKRVSDEVRRNTLKLQHELEILPEQPPIILSSEKCDKDMVIVKVSFILAGEERIMIYPVMLVNNKWIVNVGDAVNPMDGDVVDGDVILVESVSEIDSAKRSPLIGQYSETLNMLQTYRAYFVITNNEKKATITGWQNCPSSPNNFSASYGISYLNVYGDWMSTGKPSSVVIWNGSTNDWFAPQTFENLIGKNIQLALEVRVSVNRTTVAGNIYDGD